jgi:two-component system, OmpR family, phosphate regulon sensor histidine kinase PhoR
MTSGHNIARAVYELAAVAAPASAAEAPAADPSLPEPMLLENVRWFCRLRWMVVAMLGIFGILGLVPGALPSVGLHPSADWPLAAAAVLAAGNAGFWLLARAQCESTSLHCRINLWGQIIFDLLVLTAVIHFVGSRETFIPFAFLFHIVLACIFLTRRESLLVTLLACALYVLCVAAEAGGVLRASPLYLPEGATGLAGLAPWAPLWNLLLAMGIWLTVWYLACHLSAMVRERDRQLAETNRRLEAALAERSQHMLRTTHELKAPFAAIHAMAQVLLDRQCYPLPEEARAFVQRISDRCRRLADEIQQMVQLSNLRSESQGPLPMATLDVSETLNWCVAQVLPLAEERQVHLETDIRPAWTRGVDDHLKMLFSNLLGNAVIYSRPGGRVGVKCGPAEAGGATVTIEDQGIGIPADKLPRIFDEYYRTGEAVRHNKQSSGLGLAIVRHVAQTHGIGIRVESGPDVGTTFKVHLGRADRSAIPGSRDKEIAHGLPHDRG